MKSAYSYSGEASLMAFLIKEFSINSKSDEV
jgi:hypothetical protein